MSNLPARPERSIADPKWNGEVHPAADAFPMMAEDELAELAGDIAANGFINPIVLLPDGTLLEGRNRLAACQRVAVEPTFTVYDGDDPAGYVLSANAHRRHMSKGALAMAAARVITSTGAVERGGRQRAATAAGTSPQRLSYALVVLEDAPELADVVLAGGSLDDAYKEARERKFAADSIVARLDRLRSAFPDLAEGIDAERLTLDEAEAVAKTRRERAERDAREIEDGRQNSAWTVRKAIAVVANRGSWDWLPGYLEAVPTPIEEDEWEAALAGFRLLTEAHSGP